MVSLHLLNKIYLQDKFDDDDKDANIANEHCPSLNHNFLDLFESEIQNEFLKDEKVSEKDVEEVLYNFNYNKYILSYKVNCKLVW